MIHLLSIVDQIGRLKYFLEKFIEKKLTTWAVVKRYSTTQTHSLPTIQSLSTGTVEIVPVSALKNRVALFPNIDKKTYYVIVFDNHMW